MSRARKAPVPEIEIRRAVPGDEGTIAGLIFEAFAPFRDQYTPGAFDYTAASADRVRERFAEGPMWLAYLDGEPVGKGRVDATQALVFSADETTDIGYESGTTVSSDYTAKTSRFTGRINWVQLDVGTDDHDHYIDPQERLRIANHRAQLTHGGGAIIVIQRLGPPAVGRDHAVMVRVADVDAHCAHARARGAHIVDPPATHPYGERQYTAIDLGGHAWTFTETVLDVDPQSWGGELRAD